MCRILCYVYTVICGKFWGPTEIMYGSDFVAMMSLEGTNGIRLKVWMECN